MWRAAKRMIEALFKDTPLWSEDLKPHATGEFSMAVVQGNATLEDQCQVYTSPNSTLIGVYDGHGGSEASRFVNTTMLRRLTELEAHTIEQAFSEIEGQFLASVRAALAVQSDPSILNAGTCCIVGVITAGSLIVANLGDSRAVLGKLSRFAVPWKRLMAERLTRDHNARQPGVRIDLERLHNSPYVVSMVGGVWRVGGGIQVSRSIGDYNYKQPIRNNGPSLVSPEPEIHRRNITKEDKFVIFATDAFWKHIDDAEAVQIVSKNARRGIAKRLVRTAVERAGSKSHTKKGARKSHDDISVVVVFLDGGETEFDAGSTFTSCPEDISAHIKQMRGEVESKFINWSFDVQSSSVKCFALV